MRDLVSFGARSTIAAFVLGLTACDAHVDPSAPSAHFEPPSTQSQLSSHASFAITSLSVSTKILVLDGAVATYTATISSTVQSFKGLTVVASFVQQQTRRALGSQAVPCGFGSSTCTYTNPIQASGLVPGSAIFELQLLDSSGTVISTQDVPVTIVRGQTIRALSVTPTNIVVGGPTATYTATLQNQAAPVTGVAVQGWFIQGGANPARRATGSIAVQCGSGSGVFPSGTCSISNAVSASNATAGTGTLVPGPATFELELTLNGVVVSLDSVPVTIASGASITSVRLAAMTSDTLLLEGASASFTAALQNIGSTLTGVSIQSTVTQGTTRRFAGGTLISCGGAGGVIASGTCSVSAAATATNNTAGTGTLVTGAANIEVQLVDAVGIVLSTATLPVFVVDGPLESGPPGPSTTRVKASGMP